MLGKIGRWLFGASSQEVRVAEPARNEVPEVIEALVVSEPVLALANIILDSAELVIETDHAETMYYHDRHKLHWPSLNLDLTIVHHTDDGLKQCYSDPDIWEVVNEDWMTPAEEDYIIHTFQQVLERRRVQAEAEYEARQLEDRAQHKAEQEIRRAKFAALVTK